MYLETRISYDEPCPLRGVVNICNNDGTVKESVILLREGSNIKFFPSLSGEEEKKVTAFAKSVAMI